MPTIPIPFGVLDSRYLNSAGDTMTGALTLPNTGLHILDTDSSHDLIIKPGSDLSDDRILNFTTGDAARTITISGNPTLDDWFDQDVKQASSPIFGGLTLNGNIALNGNYLSGDGDNEGIFIESNGDVRIYDNIRAVKFTTEDISPYAFYTTGRVRAAIGDFNEIAGTTFTGTVNFNGQYVANVGYWDMRDAQLNWSTYSSDANEVTLGWDDDNNCIRFVNDAGESVAVESNKLGTIKNEPVIFQVNSVEVMRMATTGTKIGANSTQKIGFWGVTPVVQQPHIIDADGQLADITAKFNTLLSQLETEGLLASS